MYISSIAQIRGHSKFRNKNYWYIIIVWGKTSIFIAPSLETTHAADINFQDKPRTLHKKLKSRGAAHRGGIT